MHHAIVDSLFRYVKHLQLVLFKTLELLNITRSVSVSEKKWAAAAAVHGKAPHF
jgi:hypothetical protein